MVVSKEFLALTIHLHLRGITVNYDKDLNNHVLLFLA